MYRKDGPEAMRPVGETEFVNGIAAMSASGGYGDMRACAGIVSFADLHWGGPSKKSCKRISRPRRRVFAASAMPLGYDDDPKVAGPIRTPNRPGLYATENFREGFAS